MAFDIDYFLKINNTYGTTSQKDTQLYNLKSQINDRFTDTIDCYKVKVNDVDRELLIIRTMKQDEKTIKSRPDEDFSVGDYVVFENKTWLVISKDECNQAYTTGMMKLTNFTLHFQSPDGTILSYPCIDESSNSVGIEESNTINVLNGIKRIKLPFDDNTKLIGVDDRFFVDKSGTTTYAVTNVNNTEYSFGDKGLIVLTMKQDGAYNSHTDINGVCNYFEPIITPTPPNPDVPTEIVTITSDITNNQVILGITHTFSATFKNELGQDVANVIAQYSVDNTYSGKVALVDNGNGTATITVGGFDDTDLCTKQFTLRCYDVTHGFESTVLLTIVGIY